MTRDDFLRRISELLQLKWHGEQAYDVLGEVYSGTIAIATQLWGANSPQVEAAKQLRIDMQSSDWSEPSKAENLVLLCHGLLRSYASDIAAGRLGTLQLEYQGQVFADLVNTAKAAIAEGAKDVAAVLAAAALEDTLKRYADAKGLDVEDKDLTTVVNALKGAGLMPAPQSTLLKGMVPFRNKALHAEWAKIGESEISAVIAFVEDFLSRKFA
jgi:uncharacterized protein YutE (UPF0331/DUF86 family)